MRTLLLPGMDGTGLLFAGLTRELPETIEPDVIRYSTTEALGYDALFDRINTNVDESIAIVAESFSGPLGIRLAAQLGERVRALVLVATFARSPSWLAPPASVFGSLLFRLPPPRSALRALLLGDDASTDDVSNLERVIRSVAPAVMAKRLSEIARVDVRESLARVACPTLYLRGKQDRIVGAGAVDVIRAALPSIVVEELNAPHLVLQRNTSESARLISSFIERSR